MPVRNFVENFGFVDVGCEMPWVVAFVRNFVCYDMRLDRTTMCHVADNIQVLDWYGQVFEIVDRT